MSTTGTFRPFSRASFTTEMQTPGPTIPLASATSLARWIVVPSAMGSVKGTPTSITCQRRDTAGNGAERTK